MDRNFISYSVNREDVFLNRIFALKASGFYVDVGAAHPTFENDTKALYDRGWIGINIEPNKSFFELLSKERPKDINLNLAVSDRPGSLPYYEVVGTGLSTCDDDQAKKAIAKGFEVVTHTVESESLQNILRQHSVAAVDVLKVDVEGYEFAVLNSNDWEAFRPSVVIVEATYPETSVRRPDQVTPFLSQRAYKYAYFDGLNDYYIADEFVLSPKVFDRPPNVFDGILPYAEKLLEQRAASAQALASDLESERQSSQQKILVLSREVDEFSRRQLQFEQTSLAIGRLERELTEAQKQNITLAQKLEDVSLQLEEERDLALQLEEARKELISWRDRYAKLSDQWDRSEFAQPVRIGKTEKPKPRGLKKFLRAIKRPRHTMRELFQKF